MTGQTYHSNQVALAACDMLRNISIHEKTKEPVLAVKIAEIVDNIEIIVIYDKPTRSPDAIINSFWSGLVNIDSKIFDTPEKRKNEIKNIKTFLESYFNVSKGEFTKTERDADFYHHAYTYLLNLELLGKYLTNTGVRVIQDENELNHKITTIIEIPLEIQTGFLNSDEYELSFSCPFIDNELPDGFLKGWNALIQKKRKALEFYTNELAGIEGMVSSEIKLLFESGVF